MEGNQRTSLCLPETIGAIKIPRAEKTNGQPLCRDFMEASRLRFGSWVLSLLFNYRTFKVFMFCYVQKAAYPFMELTLIKDHSMWL